MRVLVSAFEPFDGQAENASWQGVRLIGGESIAGAAVEMVLLPVLFGTSFDRLWAEVEKRRPDLLLMVGEAGERTEICVERIACNLQDASIPDNAGSQPRGAPVIAEAPHEYSVPLPVEVIAAAVAAAGIPARISDNAGRYVCNDLYYRVQHRLSAEPGQLPALFVHVPRHGMAPAVIAEALKIAIATTLDCAARAGPLETRGNLHSPAARAGTPAGSIIEKG